MNGEICIQNLKKSFGKTEVFKDFSLCINQGEITAIIGPNGSGKSTLLNIMAGIVDRDGGVIDIENSNRYKFSYIFQDYRESLLSWRTNFENLALPLEIQRIGKAEIVRKVKELQSIFEFNFDWGSYPYELSGGQQQILAFMRALITDPKVLFIDESFSALDYENNLLLRQHLQKYFLLRKPTVLMVTHNIEEAVHLAERIVVFSPKPTTVTAVIKNSLSYPRTFQSLKTEQFHRVKDEVLSAFQKIVNL